MLKTLFSRFKKSCTKSDGSPLVHLDVNIFQRKQCVGYNEEELYYYSLTTPSIFKERFGFELNEDERRQVLDLQAQFKLCDWEVKLLKRAGDLRRNKKGEFGLIAERWSWWYGCTLTLYTSLSIAVTALGIAVSDRPPLMKLAAFLCLIAIYAPALWFNFRIMMLPWLILLRRGCEPGKWHTAQA